MPFKKNHRESKLFVLPQQVVNTAAIAPVTLLPAHIIHGSESYFGTETISYLGPWHYYNQLLNNNPTLNLGKKYPTYREGKNSVRWYA
jgi:hypothetical protein